MNRRNDRFGSDMTVVKHCEDITGTFVQYFEEFLNLFLMVYGSGIFKVEQVVFNIR